MKSFLGPFLLLTATFLYMFSFSLAKYLGAVVPVLMVMLFRFLAGPLYMTPLLVLKKQPLHLYQPWLLALRIVSGLFAMYCFFRALQLGTAGNATLLFQTAPIWTLIVSYFLLGERPRFISLFAMGLAIMGLICVIQPTGTILLTKSEQFGLLGSFSNTLVFLSLKSLRRRHDAFSIVYLTYGIASIILIGPVLYQTKELLSVSMVLLLLLMGAIGVVGQYLMTVGFKFASASVSSFLLLAVVPFMYLSGYFVFGESVNALGIVGVGTVLLALGIISKYQ